MAGEARRRPLVLRLHTAISKGRSCERPFSFLRHFRTMSSKTFHTRIAPTPSGYLHLGNAFNFVLTWVLARRAGGSVRLRIDDADQDKVHLPFLEDIFRSLEWLGLDWDVGPAGVGDFQAEWSQRLRYDRYFEVIKELRAADHLFACTCTRREIRDVSPDLTYPGTCVGRGLRFDAPDTSWRLTAPDASVAYPIIKQKNGAPAYMVVSVVDDVDHGITHIIRGEDLRPTSETQQFLANLLPGLAPFRRVQIQHHALVTDEAGSKLSKSQGSTDLREIRDSGRGPEEVYRLVAHHLGLDGALTLRELID